MLQPGDLGRVHQDHDHSKRRHDQGHTSLAAAFPRQVLRDATRKLYVADIWRVLQVGDKYSFYKGESYKEKMRRRKRSDHNETREEPICTASFDMTLARELLFPAYAFDDAQLFQYLAKYLTYESAFHISELNPSAWYQMYLPARVIHGVPVSFLHLFFLPLPPSLVPG